MKCSDQKISNLDEVCFKKTTDKVKKIEQLSNVSLINMLSLSERLKLAKSSALFNSLDEVINIDEVFKQSPFTDDYLIEKWYEKNNLNKIKLQKLHGNKWLSITSAINVMQFPFLKASAVPDHYILGNYDLNELEFLKFELNEVLLNAETELKSKKINLAQQVYLSEKLLNEFLPLLISKLSKICFKTIEYIKSVVNETNSHSQVRHYILTKFPTLFRQCVQTIIHWKAFVLDFSSHLISDFAKLETIFNNKMPIGSFSSLIGVLGDSHNKGRFTFVCEFSCGLKVVYKPRDLALEQQFYSFLSFLSITTEIPDFYKPKFILSNGYGWMEYIETQPCSDTKQISEYYYRAGCLLSILYLLEAEDIHFENVIARQSCPVVVDIETLFHLRDDSIKSNQSNPIEHSVLKTHFIPQFESTEINDDIAAILVVSDTSIELDRVSLPLLLNTRIPANDYKIEFIDGFKSAYQELSLSTSVIFNELNHFTGLLARYIPRTTAMYSRLWQSSCQPYYQQSGIKQELHYEKLWLDAKRRPHLSKLINQEKQDMLNADIPFFQHTVGSKDLLVEKRLCVKNYFKQDSLALVREKLAYLSIEDCAAQVKIIERSLNLANPNKVSLIKNNLSIKNENFNWLDQSQSIANIIKEQASVSTHSIFWPVTKYHHTGIYCLDSTNYSLHDGVLGIIHYFAYLNEISKNAIDPLFLKSATKQLFNSLVFDNFMEEGCGAFEGLGGVIYSLSHLIHLWNDEDLKHLAKGFINLISEQISLDTKFDVMSGSAGAILGLLSYFHVTADKQALSVAVSFGEHLVNSFTCNEKACGWPDSNGNILTGFAHGIAGISYALLKLYQLVPNEDYLRVGNQARSFEHSSYCHEISNWLDLRLLSLADQKKGAMTAWCHGAMGIGYSRILTRQANSSYQEKFNCDIQRAKQAVLANTKLNNYGLCHGFFGNYEFIQQLIINGNCSEFESKSFKKNINDRLTEINVVGLSKSNHVFEELGLMNGLSGIGYQLLRFTQPERIPSMLMLQPPIK